MLPGRRETKKDRVKDSKLGERKLETQEECDTRTAPEIGQRKGCWWKTE